MNDQLDQWLCQHYDNKSYKLITGKERPYYNKNDISHFETVDIIQLIKYADKIMVQHKESHAKYMLERDKWIANQYRASAEYNSALSNYRYWQQIVSSQRIVLTDTVNNLTIFNNDFALAWCLVNIDGYYSNRMVLIDKGTSIQAMITNAREKLTYCGHLGKLLVEQYICIYETVMQISRKNKIFIGPEMKNIRINDLFHSHYSVQNKYFILTLNNMVTLGANRERITPIMAAIHNLFKFDAWYKKYIDSFGDTEDELKNEKIFHFAQTMIEITDVLSEKLEQFTYNELVSYCNRLIVGQYAWERRRYAILALSCFAD